MIKKFLLATTLISTLILGCHLDATYKMDATVYSINRNEITLEDITGNLFSYYGDTENLHIGQNCKIKFDHNGTETNRKDDKIISVRFN